MIHTKYIVIFTVVIFINLCHSQTASEDAALSNPVASDRLESTEMADRQGSTSAIQISPWLNAGYAPTGAWFGTPSPLALHLYTDGIARLTIQPTGELYVAGSMKIDGITTTKVLTITGGADLAEPFRIKNDLPVPQGSVVIIDDKQEGVLKPSEVKYDTRVAGVVSGAGGVNPGLILQQKGRFCSGVNVALAGRVYVLATAGNGAIKPGDLLTTSNIPGHAMKLTDKSRAHGAVIGKAMGSLPDGEGQVLILVTLQ